MDKKTTEFEWTGKNVEIYLTESLVPILPFTANDLKTVKGKVIEKSSDGFLIQMERLGSEKNLTKFPYKTIFIPTHKIDFIGLIES